MIDNLQLKFLFENEFQDFLKEKDQFIVEFKETNKPTKGYELEVCFQSKTEAKITSFLEKKKSINLNQAQELLVNFVIEYFVEYFNTEATLTLEYKKYFFHHNEIYLKGEFYQKDLILKADEILTNSLF